MSARSFSSALAIAFALLVLRAAEGRAQRPSFDVATVKRNVSLSQDSSQRNMPGGRINFTNQRLRNCIRAAFGGIDVEVVGGPDWVDNDRWDIVAVPAQPAADAPWREMLKTLLMDRFKLKARIEQRERPVFFLVFARPDKQLGPKIQPTKTPCRIEGDCGGSDTNTNGATGGTIHGTARTMAQVGRSLVSFTERRVLDRTGLEGRYDFELTWGEDNPIFTALSDQLGFRLEAARAPVDVVVIDSVERAVED